MHTLVLSSVTEECGVLCVIPSSPFLLQIAMGKVSGFKFTTLVKILCLKTKFSAYLLSSASWGRGC